MQPAVHVQQWAGEEVGTPRWRRASVWDSSDFEVVKAGVFYPRGTLDVGAVCVAVVAYVAVVAAAGGQSCLDS